MARRFRRAVRGQSRDHCADIRRGLRRDAPEGRNRDGRRAHRAQRLAYAQRRDAVARVGALSGVPRAFRADFLPGRPHHLCLPAHRLFSAAGDWLEPGQAASELHPADRHGLHLDRPGAAGLRQHLWLDPHVGRAGRRRQRRVPSRRRRGSRARPPAAGTASRRACFRSAATSASRSGRCSRPSSLCLSASTRCSPSRFSRWRRWLS